MRWLTSVKSLRLISAVLIGLVLTGCLEEDKKFKEWAIRQSSGKFEAAIESDARARVAKTLIEVPTSLKTRIEGINHQVTPALSRIETYLQKREDLAAAGGSRSSLDEARTTYFATLDLYLSTTERLAFADQALNKTEGEIENFDHLCDRIGSEFLIPPADVAGMSAALGSGTFSVYLGLAMQYGPSGGANAAPELSPSPDTYPVKLIYDLNHALDSLFASDEERNAMHDAQVAIEKNFPTPDRRKEIISNACKSVRNLDLRGADGRSTVDSNLSLLKEYLALSQDRIAIDRDAVHRELLRDYAALMEEAFAHSDYSLDGVEIGFELIGDFLDDVDSANTLDEVAYSDYTHAALSAARRDCVTAKSLWQSATSKSSLLGEMLQRHRVPTNPDDPWQDIVPGLQSRLDYLRSQMHRSPARQLCNL